MMGHDEDDWIFQTLRVYQNFYELDLLRYVRFALRNRPGLIADVGANIGNHAVFFGLIMQRPVLCFEPRADLFKLLQSNLTKNKVTHNALNIGLGEAKGTFAIDLNNKNASDNVGATRLVKATGGDICVRRLDDIYKDGSFGRLAAIKADIEGMEAAMLRGARETITAHQPDLFIEIGDEYAMREIENILHPLGYKRLYSFSGTPVWHFVHEARLTKQRALELAIYKRIMRVTRLPLRVAGFLK